MIVKEAHATLQSGRTLNCEVLPNGGVRVTAPFTDPVRRVTIFHAGETRTLWPVHQVPTGGHR